MQVINQTKAFTPVTKELIYAAASSKRCAIEGIDEYEGGNFAVWLKEGYIQTGHNASSFNIEHDMEFFAIQFEFCLVEKAKGAGHHD
jgi:hypothetical protein